MTDPAGAATADRAVTTRLPAAERREQLLQVALETFGQKGFHDTSMNDVAEAAGVTKPVLYQHFASKKALYNELVDELGARLERTIFEAAAAADGPRQQVEAGFRAYFRWAIAQGSAFRVLFNSYYNGVGDKHPRPERGLISRPDLRTVLGFEAGNRNVPGRDTKLRGR